VPFVGFVLDVSNRDGDAAFAFFGGVIDAIESSELGFTAQGHCFGDSSGQRRLTVVNVSDGSHVHVGFGALKLLLCHLLFLLKGSYLLKLTKNSIFSIYDLRFQIYDFEFTFTMISGLRCKPTLIIVNRKSKIACTRRGVNAFRLRAAWR
jgi:hypothetical protein